MHSFASLDLSSNKLGGTLVDGYLTPATSITLTVNHLSGNIPSTFRSSNATLDVLEGNLFACPSLRNDVHSQKSPCGSSNLEYPVFTWLVLFVLLLTVAIYLYNSKSVRALRFKSYISDWFKCVVSPNSSEIYHTESTLRYLESACSMALIVSIFFVFVAFPSFVAMKEKSTHDMSLYQVQFMWTTSSAYLVGSTPTFLIWLYLTLTGVVVVIQCIAIKPVKNVTTVSDYQRQVKLEDIPEEALEYQYTIKSLVVRVVVGMAVSVLALAINYGFIHIVYFNETSNVTAVNLAFAIIKFLMNAIVVPLSTKLVSRASKQSHTVLTVIMVNVICPGLAVLVSSPLCMYDYLVKKSISVSYQYSQWFCCEGCQTVVACLPTKVTGLSVFTPKWFYSYQCSSSFLTAYLPNFVYIYTISGLVLPLVNLLIMLLSSSGVSMIQNESNEQQKQTMFIAVSRYIYDKIRVGRIFFIIDDKTKYEVNVEMTVLDKTSSSSQMTVNRITTITDDDRDYDIEVADLMPSLCIDIIMLLTFGLASPIFAIMTTCKIITITLLWRLAIGRYISIVSKIKSSSACYEKLERAFFDEWRALPRSWCIVSVFVGIFWSVFVNDMIGDEDSKSGITKAVLMMIWCPLVFISLQWLISTNPDRTTTSTYCSGRLLSRIRDSVHDISSFIHIMIWKYIFHMSPSASRSVTKTSERSSTVNETISPLEFPSRSSSSQL